MTKKKIPYNSLNTRSVLRAVEYARYSSNNQREESIDAQFRAIRDYAEKNEVVIVGSYQDEAVSGKTMERDNFIEMINAILKKEIIVDVILVHKFSRFARNKYDSAINKKKLKALGVTVVSVTQSIDDTPEGAMLESIIEAMDEYYSANLTLEVQKGLKENALKGMHTGGLIPFGFKLSEARTYIPNENAKAVKYIFEAVAEGKTMSSIIDYLTAQGVRNQKGKPLNRRSLYEILHNEKYIGNYVYHLKGSPTIRLDGAIPQIIDFDLWQKVHQRLKARKLRTRSDSGNKYFLTGKAVCGICGCSVAGGGSRDPKGDGNKVYYYRCSGYKLGKTCWNATINKIPFEQAVLQIILATIMDEDVIKDIVQLAYNRLATEEEKPLVATEKLQAELYDTFKKEENLAQLFINGKISENVLNAEADKLILRKQEIENELRARKAVGQTSDINTQKLYDFYMTFINSRINENTGDTSLFTQHMVETFVDEIILHRHKIEVLIKPNFAKKNEVDNMRFTGAEHILSTYKHPVKIAR